jgi:hypothetical protein
VATLTEVEETGDAERAEDWVGCALAHALKNNTAHPPKSDSPARGKSLIKIASLLGFSLEKINFTSSDGKV